MNIKYLFSLLLLCITFSAVAQNKTAYRIYNKKGKKVSYRKMIKSLKKSDIILFGEFHNSPISHWLQLETAKDLAAEKDLLLGAEMFERDNQEVLNRYLSEEIDYSGLDTLARLWPNYKTDYAPLVNLAKEKNLPFIATNIPRRLAVKVYRGGGFDALNNMSEEEKNFVAPMPIAFDSNLPTYKEMMTMMGGHGSVDLVKAQAIKDATMAYSIQENYRSGSTFLHFNGSYHSDFYEGILWYLKTDKVKRNYATISTVNQENVYKLEDENKGRADFIICVDMDMTTTY